MRTGRAFCVAALFTAAAVCGAAAGEEAQVLTGTTGNPPSGWTYSGLGSEYTDASIKLDATGDYVITKLYDAVVTNIVIVSKGNSTSGTTLDIIPSSDRQAWNTEKKLVLTPANNSVTTQSFDFAESDEVRAFKLLMQKTDGNIGLYYVKVVYLESSGPSPLAAPMALEATAVNADTFIANWSAVAEATGYLLDVWTILGIPPTKATEGFDNYPSSTPDGWTITNGSTTTYTTSGNFGAAAPSVRLDATGHEIVTCVYPAAVTNFSFWYKGQGASNSFLNVHAHDGAEWTQLEPVPVVNSGTIMDYNLDINEQYVQFKLVYQKDSGNIAIDDISASYGEATESFILSNESVASTNYNLSGLTPGVYYYRVRAEDGERVSVDSNVITVDTVPVPPVVERVAPQMVRLGATLEFAVTVMPTEGDAVTATNAVAQTDVAGAWTFEQGAFSFTPLFDDLGERIFVFTAEDKDGWSDPMAVTVTVRRAQTQAVVMDAVSGDYTQAFDTLEGSGTPEWDNLAWPLPAWSAFAGTTARTSYQIGTGTGATGGLYSWGNGADRAIGSLASGGNQYVYGVAFTNATGHAVTNLNVSFTAEQWRAANETPQTLHFEYCVTNRALPLIEGAWRRVKGLCFVSPVVTNGSGAVYAAAFLSARIPRPVAADEVALLRWRDPDDAGSDHAFGVDDLAVTWAAGAMPDAIPVGLAGVNEDFDEMGGSATEELPWMWRVESRDAAPRVSGSYAAAGNRTAQANSVQNFTSAGSYNFAATSTLDRAVGGLSDATAAKSVTVAAKFSNVAGMALKNWQVCYNVEKYRNGTVATAVRLLMSDDGETWQAVGAPTVFAADADTEGYAVDARPGATVAEERLVKFAAPVAKGGVFYLAWQIAVAEGDVTADAQALGVDDIVVMPRVPNGSVVRVE